MLIYKLNNVHVFVFLFICAFL